MPQALGLGQKNSCQIPCLAPWGPSSVLYTGATWPALALVAEAAGRPSSRPLICPPQRWERQTIGEAGQVCLCHLLPAPHLPFVLWRATREADGILAFAPCSLFPTAAGDARVSGCLEAVKGCRGQCPQVGDCKSGGVLLGDNPPRVVPAHTSIDGNVCCIGSVVLCRLVGDRTGLFVFFHLYIRKSRHPYHYEWHQALRWISFGQELYPLPYNKYLKDIDSPSEMAF